MEASERQKGNTVRKSGENQNRDCGARSSFLMRVATWYNVLKVYNKG